ncbi:MAG: 16S rRNA (adenine(1518)-N(6)/adenine(1519)-N(6))-dimethyltransferase RsmA [Planctomycetota bacterium]
MRNSEASPPTNKTAVQALLAANGLFPKKMRGQHFLIDPNLIEAIARHSGATRDDCVLEVGTGTGVLTWELAARAGCVVTCDVDVKLQKAARGAAAWPEHVRFESGDVLKSKRELNPNITSAWLEEQSQRDLAHLLVAANLPYSVATPFLASLLWSGIACRDIVVLVQKEAAERFVADVGTAEYGPMTVAVGLLAEAKIERAVGPRVFWPEPKVQSAVLRLTPKDPSRARQLAAAGLPQLLHAAFLHRRKTLRKCIDPARLEAAGVSVDARPQEVAPESWVGILNA